jgi:hypothetical protein
MPLILSLSTRARARASGLTANCPPIFNIWFENCHDQAVRAGEYCCSLNLSPLALASGPCQAVGMAKKRTKADRLRRQTEQLEKRVDRRPDKIEKKGTSREGVNQAAAQTVREVTEGR